MKTCQLAGFLIFRHYMYNPQSANKERPATFLIMLLGIGLVALNITRAINVPVTHDEAWTFNAFVSSTYRNILINSPVTANNHILNSLLAKFFTGIFQSNAPFIIRMPNILALIVYLISGYLLLHKLFENKWWVLAGMLLLNLNPFLFDFWGLCRGYGLAIALMMASVYFFVRYDMDAKPHYLFLTLLMAGLATISNFSMLNFYLALIGIIVLQALVAPSPARKLKIIWASAAVIICTALLYIMIVQPIIELRQNGELYFGGSEGFIPDTVKSLVSETTYSYKANEWVNFITYAAVVLSMLATVVFIYGAIKNKFSPVSFRYLYILLFLFIPALSTILQYHLLGTLYLIERTALFFYPLWILVIIIGLFSLKHIKLLSFGLLSLLIFASGYNFMRHINISYSRVWEYDRYDRLVIERMINNTPHPVKVKPHWLFINSFKYYSEVIYNKEMDYVEDRFNDSVYTPLQYDYYYIHRDDLGTLPPVYKLDTSFFDGKYLLFKKQD